MHKAYRNFGFDAGKDDTSAKKEILDSSIWEQV